MTYRTITACANAIALLFSAVGLVRTQNCYFLCANMVFRDLVGYDFYLNYLIIDPSTD